MSRRFLALFPVLAVIFFAVAASVANPFWQSFATGALVANTVGFVITDTAMRKRQRAREKRRVVPPLKQVNALAKQYDLTVDKMLPLATAPPPSAAPVITPLLKSAPLPRVVAVEGWDYKPVTGNAVLSESELAEFTRDLAAAVKGPEPDQGYVPAGQAELSAALLEHLADQVTEARRTAWTAGRKREWRVSPEWLAEMQSLRTNGASGKSLWVPRMRTDPGYCESLPGFVLGYPVVVADHFGVPELKALLSC